MRIGDLQLTPPLLLAPMEGVTDITFRRLIRQVGGCGLTVTEFIPGRSLKDAHRKALEMAQFDPDEHPISIQIYGKDPDVMADAARYAQDLGADIVDLNMGCPSKKVCRNSGGSALMREPVEAQRIVAAMRAAVSVPFTVKMRAGWDPDHRNAPEIAHMCEEEGAEMVVVHWRTRTDLYGGEHRLDTVAEVKDRLTIPVVANGDVVDVPSALHALEATGCDGLMIGRGAIRDPWVFRRIERALAGRPPLVVDVAEQGRVLLAYYAALGDAFDHDRRTLGRIKKIARYFTEGVQDGHLLRHAVFHSNTVAEATRHVRAFFSALEDGRDPSTTVPGVAAKTPTPAITETTSPAPPPPR